MNRRFLGWGGALVVVMLCCGCRTADAVRDGVAGGISDTVSTLLVALLLP